MNDLTVTDMKLMSKQINSLIEQIKEITTIEEIRDFYKKMKATREYLSIMKEVDKMRDELLKIEIACIIKAHELGDSIKGISKTMAEYFSLHGYDLKYYNTKYPDAITARQIYNAYKFSVEKKKAYNEGVKTATGENDIIRTATDEELRKYALSEEYTLEAAMKVVIDKLVNSEQSFTVSELFNRLPIDIPDAYKEGIKEVCRKSLMRSKIDTMGNKKVPKFVTFFDESIKEWVRIPFNNANLGQLEEMIILREEQLKQDVAALENLKKIYKQLSEMTTVKSKNKSIENILKLSIEGK